MATLKHAFNAKDMNSLVYRIIEGKVKTSKVLFFFICAWIFCLELDIIFSSQKYCKVLKIFCMLHASSYML